MRQPLQIVRYQSLEPYMVETLFGNLIIIIIRI